MTVALTVSVVDVKWHDMVVYWSILNKDLLMATRPRTFRKYLGACYLAGLYYMLERTPEGPISPYSLQSASFSRGSRPSSHASNIF